MSGGVVVLSENTITGEFSYNNSVIITALKSICGKECG
jgi:hypothetical protein